MEKSEEKVFTVFLAGVEYEVRADRFVVDDKVLIFLKGTDHVAAFARWDGVI